MKYICLACDCKFSVNADNAWHLCPECGGDAWWEDSGYIKGTVSTPVVPSWRKYEKEMRTGTPNEQIDAMDKFISERDSAIKKDPKVAKWERSRKDWFNKQKPKWVKAGRKI